MLLIGSMLMSDTLVCSPPNRAPATPAMNAEMQNTASLVLRMSSPSVAHAAWLSRSADSRRPKAPRFSPSTPTATRAKTAAQSTKNALSP